MAGTTTQSAPRLGATHQRIMDLMDDGVWYSRKAILNAISPDGRPPRQGLRPLRSLRLKGYVVHMRKSAEHDYIYRIELASNG